MIGLNGAILLAFLLGSPANELVLPILIIILTAGTSLGGETSAQMAELLMEHGWTWQLTVCTIVFFLFHWPCTTTLLTIHKETHSAKWTALAALLPTAFGVAICALLSMLFRMIT